MSVYPSLTYRDVDAALDDLSVAFGFTVRVEDRDGDAIRAASLAWKHGAVMVQPELPEELHGEHAGRGWVYVVVDDPDAHHAQASASGLVEILNAPHDAFDATQRGYSARDREGNLWSFGSLQSAAPTGPVPSTELLDRLHPLLGAWTEQVSLPGVPPGRMSIEPVLDGRFVLQRCEMPDPAFPDSWMMIAADDDGENFTQLYFDTRGVTRTYAMTFDGRHWTLRREADGATPSLRAQRFDGTLSADRCTIIGAWQSRRDDQDWQHDFDVTYTKETQQ
jgi:uncharacterized glyoxalase superfamily protein PhnB